MTFELRRRDGSERDEIARIRRGDAAAFEAIFRAHYATLCRYARGYRLSREAAEDLVQDVFLRVWDARADWAPAGSVAAYLHAAVRNRALDYARHDAVHERWRRHAADDDVVALAAVRPVADPADAALELAELDAVLGRAVARLPDRCRQTFLLCRASELSYAEIAAVMNVSVKTVKEQMARALRVLRAAVEPVAPPNGD